MTTSEDYEYMEELSEQEIDDLAREYLNDTHEAICIAGCVYLAGDILYEIDPVAFSEVRTEWLDTQEDIVCIDDTYYRKEAGK